MRSDLVEERRWLNADEYDEGLAIATACPGPLAYQFGIYCGYVLRGLPGAIAAALAFAAASFALVTAAAYLYVHFSGAWETRALFYGVGPVVVALILKACWNLGRKTLGRDVSAWIFFSLALILTLTVQRELALLFVAAGIARISAFSRGGPRNVPSTVPTGICGLRRFRSSQCRRSAPPVWERRRRCSYSFSKRPIRLR